MRQVFPHLANKCDPCVEAMVQIVPWILKAGLLCLPVEIELLTLLIEKFLPIREFLANAVLQV